MMSQATPMPTPEQTALAAELFGFPLKWVILAGAAALLLIIGVIVIIVLSSRLRRQKKSLELASDLPPDAPPVAPPPVKKGFLAGVVHNIGARQQQEDSWYISNIEDAKLTGSLGVLAVMADGMGGLAFGEQVSRTACEVFGQLFPFSQPELSPQQRLMYLLEMATDAVDDLQQTLDGHGGSTLTAALIESGELWTLSVGDSGIALIRGGALIWLNREHTYAVELDDDACRGRLSFEEAASDPQRRALTSYLGMGELKCIDRATRPLTLLPGDCVILMSDGVFNALSDSEIAGAVYGDPVQSAARLEAMILEKQDPNQDNFTAVLLSYV